MPNDRLWAPSCRSRRGRGRSGLGPEAEGSLLRRPAPINPASWSARQLASALPGRARASTVNKYSVLTLRSSWQIAGYEQMAANAPCSSRSATSRSCQLQPACACRDHRIQCVGQFAVMARGSAEKVGSRSLSLRQWPLPQLSLLGSEGAQIPQNRGVFNRSWQPGRRPFHPNLRSLGRYSLRLSTSRFWLSALVANDFNGLPGE